MLLVFFCPSPAKITLSEPIELSNCFKKSLSSERDKQVLNQTSYTQLPAKPGVAGTRPGEM